MTIKRIAYAYPTSIMAQRLCRYQQGCYYIELLSDENDTSGTIHPIAFDCLKSASRAAREMPFAWSRYSRRL